MSTPDFGVRGPPAKRFAVFFSSLLVVEADVRPFMARLEQALTDVLLNKAAWHDPSRSRRDLFTPPAVTTGPDGGMRIIEGSAFTVEAQLLDPFQAYPMDLSACLDSPPTEWWCPWGSEDRTIERMQLAIIAPAMRAAMLAADPQRCADTMVRSQ